MVLLSGGSILSLSNYRFGVRSPTHYLGMRRIAYSCIFHVYRRPQTHTDNKYLMICHVWLRNKGMT